MTMKEAIQKIRQNLGRNKELKVGFLSGARYPDGTPVAMVAASNNYGTKTIPPRPFFSNMVASESPTWPKKLAALLKHNGYDADNALAVLGEDIKGALRQSIIDTNSPPLKSKTIKRKGSSKPLIHHSVMINAIDSEITE